RDHASAFVQAEWRNRSPHARPPFEVVSNGLTLRLVARRAWRASDTICTLGWGPRQATASRWTVQRGEQDHAEPRPFELRYVNHSCAPTVYFDVDHGGMRALRDI